MTDDGGYCQRACRAALAWTAEGGRPYVVLGAECRASIADFTLADTSSVSCTVNPAVEIGSPTRISSGWDLMWYVFIGSRSNVPASAMGTISACALIARKNAPGRKG